MEREQIIKALECCSHPNGCRKCPVHNTGRCWDFKQDALSLIKELTEENERLTELAAFKETEKRIVRKEAVREFAGKIKGYYNTLGGATYAPLVAFHIDEIMKEQLESEDER